jgi:hypothetical protein
MMERTGISDIRLYVRNEEDLYVPFAPDGEFHDRVKNYLRTKLSGKDFGNSVRMIVASPGPIDEDRFHSAVQNWIRDEKAIFRQEEKRTARLMRGMLVIGSVLIVLSLFLEGYAESFSYTLIPIMGSVALGRVASTWIIDWPVIKAKRTLIDRIAQSSTVVFERSGQDDMGKVSADHE